MHNSLLSKRYLIRACGQICRRIKTFDEAGFEAKSSLLPREAYKGTTCGKNGDRKSRILMKSVRISSSFSLIFQSLKSLILGFFGLTERRPSKR